MTRDETSSPTRDEKRSEKNSAGLVLRVLYRGGDRAIVDERIVVADKLHIGRAVDKATGLAVPTDGAMSREHAVIERTSAGFVVRDTGRHPLLVNGAPSGPERLLQDNDVLRAGDTILHVRLRSARGDARIPSIIGVSPTAQQLRATIALMGPTPSTVLILGESGTGKEVAARAVHAVSGRTGPFVALNCASLRETLAESQLFGHVAGAFTDAKTAQPGAFRAANGGTLMLDELGELPLQTQATLLRVLETSEVVAVGSTTPVHVDVRIVCATNKDLARATRDGSFRGDLYARVSELVLRCPPLRDRREDILLLLESALPKPHPPLSPDLAHHLMLHPWPFHVREVKKTAAMLALHAGTRSELDLELVRDRLAETRSLASSNDIEGEDDDSTAGGSRTPRGPAPDADALLELLRTHRGNVMRVAEATGRSPRQVRRWLTQHGIDADKYRG